MFKEVRLHEREEMGNKRLGGLLLWQAIHFSSKELQRSRAEVAERKSEDRKMNVAQIEMICRHSCCVIVHHGIVLFYNKLSDGEIRGGGCSTVH